MSRLSRVIAVGTRSPWTVSGPPRRWSWTSPDRCSCQGVRCACRRRRSYCPALRSGRRASFRPSGSQSVRVRRRRCRRPFPAPGGSRPRTALVSQGWPWPRSVAGAQRSPAGGGGISRSTENLSEGGAARVVGERRVISTVLTPGRPAFFALWGTVRGTTRRAGDPRMVRRYAGSPPAASADLRIFGRGTHPRHELPLRVDAELGVHPVQVGLDRPSRQRELAGDLPCVAT